MVTMLKCPDDNGCAGARPDGLVDRALALLNEALQLIDSAGVPGHIGARLQHVIEDIDARL
jgi:hypothetical protein